MLHAKKPTSYWFGDSSELITSFFSQAAPVLASSFPTEVPAASWGHHQWHPTQNAAEEQWPLVARGLWPGFSVVSVVFPVLRNGIWTENQKIQIDSNLMFFRCRCERYRSCTRQHVSWHFMTFMTFTTFMTHLNMFQTAFQVEELCESTVRAALLRWFPVHFGPRPVATAKAPRHVISILYDIQWINVPYLPWKSIYKAL